MGIFFKPSFDRGKVFSLASLSRSISLCIYLTDSGPQLREHADVVQADHVDGPGTQ